MLNKHPQFLAKGWQKWLLFFCGSIQHCDHQDPVAEQVKTSQNTFDIRVMSDDSCLPIGGTFCGAPLCTCHGCLLEPFPSYSTKICRGLCSWITLKGTLRQLEGNFCTRTTPYTCNVCYIVSKKLCVFFWGGLTTKLNFMFENDVIFSNEIFPNLSILGSPWGRWPCAAPWRASGAKKTAEQSHQLRDGQGCQTLGGWSWLKLLECL